MTALPNSMTCIFSLHCHTPLIDRYFQENSFKGSFSLFMSDNCLLACLTCQVDTRHTEPHSHIFLISLCYDAVSNCPVGKRIITLKKKVRTTQPVSQPVSLPISPCCDPGCVSVQITACERRKILGLMPDTCHFGQNYFYISNWSSWWNQLSCIKKALRESWPKLNWTIKTQS